MREYFPPPSSWSFCRVHPEIERSLRKAGSYPRFPYRLGFSSGGGYLYSSRTNVNSIIFRDSDHSLLLYRSWYIPALYPKHIACLGFSVGDGKFVVEQIQGVVGAKHALNKLKWDRLLIGAAIVLAREFGCREARVLKSERNPWWRPNDKRLCASMRMRYDVLPKRMGFKHKDPEDDRFHILPLST